MAGSTTVTTQRGGSWLLEDSPQNDTFTPERMTEEQRLIDQTAREFVANEVVEHNAQLETKDWDLARRLLERCGDLGLLGTDVPETYGGISLDKVSSAIIASRLGQSGSFSTTFGAQTGLAILPIRTFGTEDQKQRYLPKLVTGEWVGAYCLSESGSGSDALGAKTRAVRLEDGSYSLTGEKMWVSNGGFADLYVVFAKVDGEQFTAFLVERGFEGVSSGAEEHKMGLAGSSTTPVILQDARVPAGNLLGAIGQGHKVAFNVLNYGRFKLGAATVGSAQMAIGEAARYATQRQQFNQPIANFGAIKHKLGEMTIRAYAIESMVFRTAGLIDAALNEHASDNDGVLLTTLEEYAIEASILKVAGSEILDYIFDENIQIHGGNGYVKDYPAERHYRDSRVNRIFEGTNEINRLLIPSMLLRRALKGHLPLIEAAQQVQSEILNLTPTALDDNRLLASQVTAVGMFKKVALAVLGLALQTYGDKLSDQQEILSLTADILIDIFAAETILHRALQSDASGMSTAALQVEAVRSFISDAAGRIELAARSALAGMSEGDNLRIQLAALRRLLKVAPVNTISIRRQLADQVVARAGYIF
jgi:alkylation response protein AidB-like acyl-CoA dehydrogenase